MRLRYFRVRDYPPLSDLAVVFSNDPPLQRYCGIRFVVGLNGSGKSHLLRALSEAFLALDQGSAASFPFELVYELGRESNLKTVVLVTEARSHRVRAFVCSGATASAFSPTTTEQEFNDVIATVASNGFSTTDLSTPVGGQWFENAQAALPERVLAYTTGALTPWVLAWQRGLRDGETEVAGSVPRVDDIRPEWWSAPREQELLMLQAEANDEDTNSFEATPALQLPLPTSLLIDAHMLRLATLAAFVPDEVTPALLSDHRLVTLRSLKRKVGWDHAVSIRFTIDSSLIRHAKEIDTARALVRIANRIVKEPVPSLRMDLHFDLGAPLGGHDSDQRLFSTVGERLLDVISSGNTAPYQRFMKLASWMHEGWLVDASLALRKTALAELATSERTAVMPFEALSDGEQMMLGRMALFQLLVNQDDVLLLLDEPETHFNDAWKRELVDVIDDAIGATANEVLISTHAAVVLTDALREDIVLLEHRENGTARKAITRETQTFGATSDHPLRDVFGAEDTVGRRASAIMQVLSLAEQPDIRIALSQYWTGTDAASCERALTAIWQAVAAKEPASNIERTRSALDSIKALTVRANATQPISVKNALACVINASGPGYFRIELLRLWHELPSERQSNAA